MNWFKRNKLAVLNDTRWVRNTEDVEDTEFGFERKFTVDNAEYGFCASLQNRKKNEWEVVFYNLNDENGYAFDLTNKRNALQVMSAVKSIFEEFVRTRNPTSIIFSGKGKSRTSLYQKMVDRFIANLGYEYNAKQYGSQTEWHLTKKQQKPQQPQAIQPPQQNEPENAIEQENEYQAIG